jgi:Ca-activated chloride channel homolog
MATRPPRPSCAPAVRWGTRFVFLALFGILLGCGKSKDPPAVAETSQTNEDVGFDADLGGGAGPKVEKDTVVVAPDNPNEAAGVPDLRTEAVPQTSVAGVGTSGAGFETPGLAGRSGSVNDRLIRAGGGGEATGRFVDGLKGKFGKKMSGNRRNVPAGEAGDNGVAAGAARKILAGAETPDQSAERYDHFQDNPFVAVKDEALSTFSAAVDTAAYANARARIKEGQKPAKDAVRVADFVNYFPYDYATPKNGDPVAFHVEMAPCPWAEKHHLLRIGLKARMIDKDQMPARNLVFLVDTSGSMNAPNRLPLVQESLKLLVETQLTGKDRVSIVSYAGAAGLRLPPTSGDKKETIVRAIMELSSGGSTNGEGGIRMAYDQAEQSFVKEGVNRVILATDGDFNVGVSDSAALTRMIEEKRKTGVYLTVLGFGMGNLQDATLEKLAHHGNGHYAYIDNIDEAKKVFVEQGAALVTVAKDVKLQVEFNPAKVAGYRLVGYENRILTAADFRNDAKDAGDMGSGHTGTALYEIVPAGEKVDVADVEPLKYQTSRALTDAGKAGEWLTVRMRYKHPDSDQAAEVSSALPGAGLAKEPSADFRFAAAVAAFGMLLRDSEYRGTADYAKVIEWSKPVVGKDAGGHRAEFVRLAERMKDTTAKKE